MLDCGVIAKVLFTLPRTQHFTLEPNIYVELLLNFDWSQGLRCHDENFSMPYYTIFKKDQSLSLILVP